MSNRAVPTSKELAERIIHDARTDMQAYQAAHGEEFPSYAYLAGVLQSHIDTLCSLLSGRARQAHMAAVIAAADQAGRAHAA